MLGLCIFVCLLMATQASEEDVIDGLDDYKDINIDRMPWPHGTNEDEDEVLCESKKKCAKKDGVCISTNDTCIGESFKGKKWCKNSKSCQCCISIDCPSRTRPACSALNGTCIDINEVCDGRIVNHGKVFCKDPKTCKCCFPRGLSACETTAVTTETTSPPVTEVPFACGETNSQVAHDCSGTQTEVVGMNTTWSTTSNPAFTNGITIGIRIQPEPGPHDVHVSLKAPGYPASVFSVRLDENTCSDPQGCSWTYRRWVHDETIWRGTTLPCLPKNEWMLLTITDLYNGSVDATLQVREEFYSLIIPVTLPNTGVSIRVSSGNTAKHSEISLDCKTVVPFACGQQNSQVAHDCSGTETEVVGMNTTWSTTSNPAFTNGITIGIRILPEPGPHDVHVSLKAPGYPASVFGVRLDENTCSDPQGCSWTYRRWVHDETIWIGTTLPCLPKNEWMLLSITDLYNGSVDATLQVREEFYSLIIPVTLPNTGVTIRVSSGNTAKHSEISLDCNTVVPFACGQPNSQEQHDCSGTQTEVVGKNTTWSTSSAVFTSGMTIGIRILPEPGPHGVRVNVRALSTGFWLSIRLLEDTCSDLQGCTWAYLRWVRTDPIYKGTILPCLPKNEWMLLTITDLFNGTVDATLQVREEFYSLLIPASVPDNGVTISVDHANYNLHSEISLDCSQ